MAPLFLFCLFLTLSGTAIILSTASWVAIWVGLELSLFAFIPLVMNKVNRLNIEGTMKYYLVQAMGSGLLLMSGLLYIYYSLQFNFSDPLQTPPLISLITLIAMSMKIGLFPFHSWFPTLMSSLEWSGCILLNTVQKVGPIFLFSLFFLLTPMSSIILLGTALTGGVGGLSQSKMRSLLAYSSFVHLAWILCLSHLDLYYSSIYMMLYFLLSSIIFCLGHTYNFSLITISPSQKMVFFFGLLSLGGMPPLTGFIMKWFAISTISLHSCFFLLSVLLIGTLLSLYYYLSLLFSAFFSIPLTPKPLNNMEILFVTLCGGGLLFCV
uniref:NADH-ubiquinone oxidoreductase chain 2 n=1 Tax=Scutopus robustus TaxID=2109553 RepID=A0A343YNB8_9MOLL|nr:NADH dehydrogenase subunit 2 [Scutopus robustus]AWL21425.1 NADH dehydrogenase subunit 2 [Scutopus robustus]